MMPKSHTHTLTVYYEDTDAGGVVYHSVYLNFAERGRTEFLKSAGFSNSHFIQNDGIYLALRHIEVSFIKPAFLEDTLTIETTVADVKNARLTFKQRILRNETLLTEIVCEICAITKAGKPVRIPAKLVEVIKKRGYI